MKRLEVYQSFTSSVESLENLLLSHTERYCENQQPWIGPCNFQQNIMPFSMLFFPLGNYSQKLGLGICFAISPYQSNPAITSNEVLCKHSIRLSMSCSHDQILPGDRHLHLIIMPSGKALHKKTKWICCSNAKHAHQWIWRVQTSTATCSTGARNLWCYSSGIHKNVGQNLILSIENWSDHRKCCPLLIDVISAIPSQCNTVSDNTKMIRNT